MPSGSFGNEKTRLGRNGARAQTTRRASHARLAADEREVLLKAAQDEPSKPLRLGRALQALAVAALQRECS
jgi:hypothetical protein